MAVYSSDANQADFFGEGIAGPAAAPDEEIGPDGLTATQRAALRLRQNQTNNVAAKAYQGFGSVETSEDVLSTMKDSNGNQIQVIRGTPQGDAAYNAKLGTVQDLGFAGGVQQLGFTPNYEHQGAASDALGSRSVTAQQQGQQLSDQVVNAQPTPDPAHAVTAGNRDALTPFIDPMMGSDKYTDAALAMSKDLVDRVLNTPLQTKQAGDQALSNQLALARSARGGPGAVQDALNNAQAQAPELQRQTNQAAIQEQVQRAGAAGQAAGIFAGVAGGVADREVRIKEANQTAGLHVLDNLTTLTGQDLQFDANQINQIGLMARDFNAMAVSFANMDTQTQIAQWNDMTSRYGIDHNYKAAIEKIASDENIGPLDALKMALGGISAVGGLAGAA